MDLVHAALFPPGPLRCQKFAETIRHAATHYSYQTYHESSDRGPKRNPFDTPSVCPGSGSARHALRS
jgi:hypothetical protein